MDNQLITSAANPIVRLARQLATRRRVRQREGRFLVEGTRAIQTVHEHGVPLHTLIVDEERREDIAPALLASLASDVTRVVTMPSALFMSIADAEHPQPLLAIAAIPGRDFPAGATFVLALDAVRDPGNMGTIVRTAAAAGVDCVALLLGCVDPYSPKVVRASAGLVAALPIVPFRSLSDVVQRHFDTDQPPAVVAADAGATHDFRDVDWKKPLVLVVGNEGAGLSDESRRVATVTVRIPIDPGVESLNVSIATALLLFEARRQREN